jgi:hypothetical protein
MKDSFRPHWRSMGRQFDMPALGGLNIGLSHQFVFIFLGLWTGCQCCGRQQWDRLELQYKFSPTTGPGNDSAEHGTGK